MGAGVATDPHFPKVDRRAVRPGFRPSADQVPIGSCNPVDSLSGFQLRHCCLAGPLSRLRRNIAIPAHSLSRSLCPKAPVPLDGPESGSGFGFRLRLTLLPRSPCPRFQGGHPRGRSSLPRRQCLEPSSVSGRPLVAQRANCSFPPSRANEIRLWINRISGITSGDEQSAGNQAGRSVRSSIWTVGGSRPCPVLELGTRRTPLSARRGSGRL